MQQTPPASEAIADPPPTPARIVPIVLNGAAGALLDRSDAGETLAQSFRKAGLEPRFIEQREGDLTRRIEIACQSGAPIVVIAGGDGSVACAAQIAAERGVALAILPFGTMNLLAKDLGLPIDDLDGAVRVIADGRIRAIDVGEVNGHVFLCASMLGLPARMARYREAGRGQRNRPQLWFRFARALLRSLARRRARRFSLRFDREELTLKASALTIVVNTFDGASGRLFARARLDGGALGVYITQRLRLRDAIRLAVRAVLGGLRTDPAFEERTTRTVSVAVRGKTIRVMNDGETMLLKPPLSYRIRPGALRVVAPEPAP
jgi:diacylglycerol kinase family enzyme